MGVGDQRKGVPVRIPFVSKLASENSEGAILGEEYAEKKRVPREVDGAKEANQCRGKGDVREDACVRGVNQ